MTKEKDPQYETYKISISSEVELGVTVNMTLVGAFPPNLFANYKHFALWVSRTVMYCRPQLRKMVDEIGYLSIINSHDAVASMLLDNSLCPIPNGFFHLSHIEVVYADFYHTNIAHAPVDSQF
jgi:hypothetical protein